jgi:hypothetical protein
MLNKKQADNEAIQDIITYYEHEKQDREYEEAAHGIKVKLGDFRVSDDAKLQICNGFINGEPRWANVPY